MLVKLCKASVLSIGELVSFRIREHEVLVVNLGSKIVCLDGRCTHAGAPLVEGTLEGEVLTCPWHYSQFNVVTGEVIRGPAGEPLRSYRTEQKDGAVFIDQ
jgi:nitrite reductase/ring-hydroxylating ferredoxin subunit